MSFIYILNDYLGRHARLGVASSVGPPESALKGRFAR